METALSILEEYKLPKLKTVTFKKNHITASFVDEIEDFLSCMKCDGTIITEIDLSDVPDESNLSESDEFMDMSNIEADKIVLVGLNDAGAVVFLHEYS